MNLFKRFKQKEPRLALICGCPRSGTSWTWGLLIEHPDIEPLLIEDFPGIIVPSGINKMKTHKGYDTTETAVFHSNLTDKEIEEAIINKADRKKRKVFLEKTPSNAMQLHRIFKIFPKAKVVYLIRDPRANINSLLQSEFGKGKKIVTSLDNAIKRYKEYIQILDSYQTDKRIFKLRYEDLYDTPIDTYNELIEFLDIAKLTNQEIEKIFHNRRRKSITTKGYDFRKGTKDSYKEELSSEQIRKITYEFSDVINKYNYIETINDK